MSFEDKRDLWYISGNKSGNEGGGDEIFAIPIVEVEETAVFLSGEVARLRDSEIDGARRWTVVAHDGEEAVKMLIAFVASLRGIRVTLAIAEQAAHDGLEVWIDWAWGCFIRTDNISQSAEELRLRYGLNPRWHEQKLPTSAFKAIPGVHFDGGTITLMEAATEYGLNYRTLQGAAKDGRLKARQSGATWLTTRRAIEQAIMDGALRSK